MPLTDANPKSVIIWYWLALAGMVGLYLVFASVIPPGADTLWRLHVADGLLDGQKLYVEMVEVNPPLWFWGAIPAAFLGGYPALVIINLAVTFMGLALFGGLARLFFDDKGQWAAILGLAVGLLLVNVGEIGQREQAFLLACALWSGLIAARIEAKAVPVWLTLAATCLASYGFALKHYFVLVPILLEATLIWHKKRSWQPLRPETLLLASLAGAYAVAVIYLTPDFLGRIIGLVQASYFGFGPWNSVGPLERQARLVLQCVFVLVPITALFLQRDKSALIRALTGALCISALIVILQQKGWRYHLIAANGLAILIMSLLWQGSAAMTTTRLVRRFLPLGLTALLWTAIIQPAYTSLATNGQPVNNVLANIIAREPRNHHIAILSTAPDNAFYPLARAGRSHWSRHYSMWMMPGLLTPQSNPKREVLRVRERGQVLKEFVSDLTCTPPDLIVGEVGYFRNPSPKLFDAIAFLQEDPLFAAWMHANYRSDGHVGEFPIWRLKAAKPAPENCFTTR